MKTAWLPHPAHPARSDEFFAETEQRQSNVRLTLAGIVALYIGLLIALDVIGPPLEGILLLEMVQLFAIALFIHWSARARPGVRHWRRALAMALDYGNTAFLIGVAGQTMTPVFVVLLWITIGYGIRYGRRYLLIAMALSQLSVLGIGLFSPYWRELPYFLITAALMALVVPAYAHTLISALRRAHDEALRADLAKSRFLAQASHDLRQPIHAIGLFTSCLKRSGLNQDQARMVDSIDRALNGVSALFRSLLDVSTLDSGRIVPRPQVVALGPLLHDVADQHGDAAHKAGVTLRVVDSGLSVRTDRAILAVMLGNLVSNAVKYAPGRKVVIGCRRRGGQVSVLICDSGPGIEPEEQARIFEEFYRSPRHRRTREGIGLGLPIVVRMARLLGLQVALDSVPGHGTTIEISGLEPTQEVAAAPAPVAAPATALAGMRILLVEDHDEVRGATRRILESWGCIVEDEASAHALPRDCDLILADQDLEDGTGGECIQRIRAALGRPVPAIIMSGHDAAHIADELPDKSLPILPKPVHPARLRAALMAQKFAGPAA
ncbi:hybrid sensor histidine kinase/response regulator [Paracoccus sp. AS002]|uniref:ATP-binding response regulator n=1 Tax=Paracoccus sp. AS002 TaxID=3019545 RepID=UPI0023E76D18|nr:hybrid sensor histidine kinase/response regulator [Paracoccus sp. AS002]MDF3904407.1 hybrid sensor histidine kinase/response regulator [Paracoccus sp. AS002]